MTLEKTYRCNICTSEIEDPHNNSFGVKFNSRTFFTLGGYGSTEGCHLCYRCARQLKKHLNNEQISKFLTPPDKEQ